MSEQIYLEGKVPPEMGGKRFDQIVVQLFPDYSRSRLQQWIKAGDITVDGVSRQSKEKLLGGELVLLNVELEVLAAHQPEQMDLDIVYEDDSILIINKPAGLVVHPAPGHSSGTLLNGLLHHFPEINQVPRAGIVHRLDMDTTGLMVVAKTLQAQTHLVDQLQDRSMGREYEALVHRVMTGGGKVDEPLGRHSKHRQKMAVVGVGKEAVTHYRLLKKFRAHTHIRLKLETGRTHQIRVHMAHLNYPLLGDQLYGGRFRMPKGMNDEVQDLLRQFKRQALHAKKLTIWHPVMNKEMSWEVDLPEDMQRLVNCLKKDALNSDIDL